MPTRNDRVNVTLQPAQYELLSRLARVQGRSRAAVLLELFETVSPVLERVVAVSEAAERAQVQAREGLRDSVERAEAAILPHVSSAMAQFDWLLEDAVVRGQRLMDGPVVTSVVPTTARPARAAVRSRAEGGRSRSTPVPVTTGVRSERSMGARPTRNAVTRSARRKK